jgi:hypothetical protein
MRVESSQVSYVTSHRSASAAVIIDETLVPARTADARAVAASGNGVQPVAADKIQLSVMTGPSAASDGEELQDLDPKQRLALLAIEALSGQRIRWLRFHPPASTKGAGGSAAVTGSAGNAGTTVVRRRTELYSESEVTNFEARGVIETADGRSIEVAATLTMQREFQSYTASVGSSNTTDPLVVNFGGTPARLTGAKISFDLNSDGKPENISFVAGGSGFLVIDDNGDGAANDGRELFGPQTGNGFGELASYDADRNGWIDENDPVFDKLRIWTQDGLSTLSEKGIGAIATSSAETPFALKDGTNSFEANIRGSGIYLLENGTVGTVQEVDLAEG